MASVCLICDKRPRTGNSVSNANNRVRRWLFPNVQKIRFTYKGQTSVNRGPVCTKCVKSGCVEKVV